MELATLLQPLRGFAVADTSSPVEGMVPVGSYPVLGVAKPNADTDYAQIAFPKAIGGDTWICTRWKTIRYALVSPTTPSDTFEGDTTAVDEAALVALLPAFRDYTYGQGRYPWPLPGVKLPLAPPKENNCCVFVEALVVKAFADLRGPTFTWSLAAHNQMMVTDITNLYSPITALVNAEMAIPVADPSTPPHPWTIVQGWNANHTAGHTFLVVRHDPDSDKVLTLESNLTFKLDGVGWRNIGMLRDFPQPGPWRTTALVPTWSAVKKRYPNRRQGWLKVRNLRPW